MNGKGSAPRPFSVSADTFSHNMTTTLHNPRDLYRQAVLLPDFHERYPHLTGVWGEDREYWLAHLTNSST